MSTGIKAFLVVAVLATIGIFAKLMKAKSQNNSMASDGWLIALLIDLLFVGYVFVQHS